MNDGKVGEGKLNVTSSYNLRNNGQLEQAMN